jgi:hypothetical protein
MVYSSHDEDMPILEEMFFPSDEGEASTSGTKSEECKAVLRSGTYVPERQALKDSNKEKDKIQNKGKEAEGLGKSPKRPGRRAKNTMCWCICIRFQHY